jgi:hypothetical protein
MAPCHGRAKTSVVQPKKYLDVATYSSIDFDEFWAALP